MNIVLDSGELAFLLENQPAGCPITVNWSRGVGTMEACPNHLWALELLVNLRRELKSEQNKQGQQGAVRGNLEPAADTNNGIRTAGQEVDEQNGARP